VTEGSGRALVVAVGPRSEWGRTMSLVVGESGETPLQEKLGVLATAIAKVGVLVAVVCFVVLMIRWMIENNGFPLDEFASGPLEFFIFAVTIVVVAVPEGLPLAVTISLAYSMGKMMKDNNFVRVLAACETMGGATAICSDKTGTLTENRMTVVEGWFAGTSYPSVPEKGALPAAAQDAIEEDIALNSKAFLTEEKDGSVGLVGNRTECALLLMATREWGGDYRARRVLAADRTVEVYGFTSERKMASVLVRRDAADGGGLRLYNKGAADWVIAKCVASVDASGKRVPMGEGERRALLGVVNEMAGRGLRTLCLAYRDFPAGGRQPDGWKVRSCVWRVWCSLQSSVDYMRAFGQHPPAQTCPPAPPSLSSTHHPPAAGPARGGADCALRRRHQGPRPQGGPRRGRDLPARRHPRAHGHRRQPPHRAPHRQRVRHLH
jgi:Ca2+-transporting ATPase